MATQHPLPDTGVMIADSPHPLRLLAAAPHRLLFFVGSSALLLGMLWWALWLLAARFAPGALPTPTAPSGWAHATVLQYQTLPMFIFGFLMTAMPRWLGAPGFSPAAYLPVGGLIFLGLLLSLAGLFSGSALFEAGLVATLAGWTVGLIRLGALLLRQARIDWHAVSMLAALGLGWLGLLAFILWPWLGEWRLAYLSIKLGTFGLLLPVFFTVTHRVLPFFAANAIPGYRPYKPMWILGAFWALLFVHLLMELAHAYWLIWIVDLPLALLTGWLWLRWQPQRSLGNGLLAVLFIAWAWLPVAFALFAAQSLWLQVSGDFVMLRAPLHALALGFFGGLLVAMVTRVTQGHSGRPLVMGTLPWIAFVGTQLAVLVRLAAEFAADSALWMAAAASLWVLALLPWLLRGCAIYLRPRADGKPG
jgi:uncharacterized protein involved in response to NO